MDGAIKQDGFVLTAFEARAEPLGRLLCAAFLLIRIRED
jgi:hypothetical protein